MNEKMNKKPVIVSNGIVKKINKILLNSDTFKESWLQEILYAEPSILPTNEIDSVYSNLIPIGREIPVPSGFILWDILVTTIRLIRRAIVTPNNKLIIISLNGNAFVI